MIKLDNFPSFNERHFEKWINELTPIEEHKLCLLKRES